MHKVCENNKITLQQNKIYKKQKFETAAKRLDNVYPCLYKKQVKSL